MGLGRLRDGASGLLTEADPAPFAAEVADDGYRTVQVACPDYAMSGSPVLTASGQVAGIQQFLRFERTLTKARELRWYFFVAPSEIRAFLAE